MISCSSFLLDFNIPEGSQLKCALRGGLKHHYLASDSDLSAENDSWVSHALIGHEEVPQRHTWSQNATSEWKISVYAFVLIHRIVVATSVPRY